MVLWWGGFKLSGTTMWLKLRLFPPVLHSHRRAPPSSNSIFQSISWLTTLHAPHAELFPTSLGVQTGPITARLLLALPSVLRQLSSQPLTAVSPNHRHTSVPRSPANGMPTPLSQEQFLPPNNHWLSNLETDWEFRNRGIDFSILLLWWSISFVNFTCYRFLMPRKRHHPVTWRSPPPLPGVRTCLCINPLLLQVSPTRLQSC